MSEPRTLDSAADPRAGRGSPLVSLVEVSFKYEQGPSILDGLSLTIPEGTVLSVTGPSGCGKTTLLNLLAGIHSPTSGRIAWSEDRATPSRHPLTMLFQKDTLLPWLNTEDNIGLHFRLSGSKVSREERRTRIAELVRLAGLDGSERKYPYELSGGMRRRTAFLAAVAPRPRTLLLDEPFSSLDEPTRIAIHQDIWGIVKTYGISVILVTHDLAEAISMSDEVVILTTRPGTIFAHHRINFGEERNMLTLREDPEFLKTYGLLWQQLNQQIRRGGGEAQSAREPES